MTTTSAAETARIVIEQIWLRARINAFAHEAAADEAKRNARTSYVKQTVATLGSVLSVILVYLIPTEKWVPFSQQFTFVFLIASILLTIYSVFETNMSVWDRAGSDATRHEMLAQSYRSISQRARAVKWPGMPDDDIVYLLRDLERDFQMLKASGIEPKERHFDWAHGLLDKIGQMENSSVAQSFPIDQEVKQAKQIGTGEVDEVDET